MLSKISELNCQIYELKGEIAKLKQKLNMKTGTLQVLKYLEKLIVETVDENELQTYTISYVNTLKIFNDMN